MKGCSFFHQAYEPDMTNRTDSLVSWLSCLRRLCFFTASPKSRSPAPVTAAFQAHAPQMRRWCFFLESFSPPQSLVTGHVLARITEDGELDSRFNDI